MTSEDVMAAGFLIERKARHLGAKINSLTCVSAATFSHAFALHRIVARRNQRAGLIEKDG